MHPCLWTDLQLAHCDTHPLHMLLFTWKDPKSDHARPHISITSLPHAPQIAIEPISRSAPSPSVGNKGWLGRSLLSRRSVLDLNLTLAITSSTPLLLSKSLNKRLRGAGSRVWHDTEFMFSRKQRQPSSNAGKVELRGEITPPVRWSGEKEGDMGLPFFCGDRELRVRAARIACICYY